MKQNDEERLEKPKQMVNNANNAKTQTIITQTNRREIKTKRIPKNYRMS